MIRTGAIVLATIGVVAALALSGCSGLPSNGPLVLSRDRDGICMPLSIYSTASYGVELPAITRPVAIESVTLVSARNIRVVKASIMPVSAHLHLLAQEYPPTGGLAKDWARSTDAVGSTIKPGQQSEIVLEVTNKTGAKGTATGARVIYTAGGKKYETRSYFALAMKPGSGC